MAGYELSRDANGNVVLVPSTTQVQQPRGFFGDVASKAREYFSPRVSDLTEGTAAAYGAGRDISQSGYENFKTNPLYGAGQIIGGSALSAISPLAGVTEYFTKPVGRTFGPAAEHAADVASMVAPLPSKGASMFKFRPRPTAAAEAVDVAREMYGPQQQFRTNARPKARPGEPEFIGPAEPIGPQMLPRPGESGFVGPSEFVGPRQPAVSEFIGPPEMHGPQQPFRTSVRPKARPGDAEFIGPMEQIGPQMPRSTAPEFIGPSEFVGPRQPPRSTDAGFIGPHDFVGPRDLVGPRQPPRPTDSSFIGPREQIGPQQLPQPTDPRFIGPREQIGPPAPAAAERMSVGSPYAGSYLPLFAGGTLAGTALLSGAQQALDRDGMNRFGQIYGGNATSSPYSLEEANRQAAIDAVRGRPEFEQGPIGSGRGAAPPSMDAYLADRAKATAANAALDVARARTAAPAQQRAPIDLTSGQPEASQGILSRIFSGKDYQSNNELVSKPMGGAPVNWGNPDSAADFFRADKALMAKRKEEEGMNRGGAANAKPDSLHKALEIIHHLLTRGH